MVAVRFPKPEVILSQPWIEISHGNVADFHRLKQMPSLNLKPGVRWKVERRWKSTCRPNFDEISQSTAEIKLLPASENRRPPHWNSISGFDVDACIVIGMSFCIRLPNFVVIGP